MNHSDILRNLKNGKITIEQAKQMLAYSREDYLLKNEYIDIQIIDKEIAVIKMHDEVNKNAFTQELIEQILHTFQVIEEEECIKAIILTGQHPFFACGGTKEDLLRINEGKAKYTDNNLYKIIIECKIPVIGAINGHALGAGWCFGMSCDFVILGEENYYAANFMEFGFTPGFGSTVLFPEKLGATFSKEVLFTGRKFKGSEIKNHCVDFPVIPNKEVLNYALDIAKSLTKMPKESLILLKENMNRKLKKRLYQGIENEITMQEKSFVNNSNVRNKIIHNFEQYTKKNDIKKNNDIQKKHTAPEPIAIIGMSGRFPDAENVQVFWNNLCDSRDSIKEIPKGRWGDVQNNFNIGNSHNGTYSKWMGSITGVEYFDASFFHISPIEAEKMDPQQRIFLEECWKCIEDAGIAPDDLKGTKCGVFVGYGGSDYFDNQTDRDMDAHELIGNSASILSARISYYLDLKGPCMAIDTACSSSLTAVAEACNSLILKESCVALAGGVCILSGPNMHIMTNNGGMLSPDGKCYTFDNRANGFVPGEGSGVVLLKRYSDAVSDGDSIYGIIKGWGINQDGKTNGITAPSSSSQVDLLSDIYERFQINPDKITLVEAHGTGTKLGDPIEMEALTEAFQKYTSRDNYCAVGSVKSNIGHLLAASGIAGLIKVILSLNKKYIPPTINFNTINKHIDIDNSPFYIADRGDKWNLPKDIEKRIACISSFGLSGTNVHLVIEEMDEEEKSISSSEENILFVLSAKSESALKHSVLNLSEYAIKNDHVSLEDIAFTLMTGRSHMPFRVAFFAKSLNELTQVCNDIANSNKNKNIIGMNHVKERIYDKEQIVCNDIEAMAEEWLKGHLISWSDYYADKGMKKLHLPTYSFDKEWYWLKHNNIKKKQESSIFIEEILVCKLAENRFEAIITGQEKILANHIVKNEKILPGVGYIRLISDIYKTFYSTMEQEEISITNLLWLRPVKVIDTDIHIEIKIDTNKDMISFCFEDTQKKDCVYAKGNILVNTKEEGENQLTICGNDKLNKKIESSELYDYFSTKEILYGENYRLVQTILYNDDDAKAEIRAVNKMYMTEIMDACLQVTSCFSLSSQINTRIPFSADFVRINSSFLKDSRDKVVISNVRKIPFGEKGITKYDVEIIEGNRVGAAVYGLMLKEYTQEPLFENIILLPKWKRIKDNIFNIISEDIEESRIVLTNIKEVWTNKLAGDGDYYPIHIGKKEELPHKLEHIKSIYIVLRPSEGLHEEWVSDFTELVLTFQQLVKSLYDSGYEHRPINIKLVLERSIYVFDGEEKIDFQLSGLYSFFSTLAKENIKWNIVMFDVENINLEIMKTIKTYNYKSGKIVASRFGHWYTYYLSKVNINRKPIHQNCITLKDNGVYIIFGGSGYVGNILTKYIKDKYNATVIWIGSKQIDKMPEYISRYYRLERFDCTELHKIKEEVKNCYGRINGVFNSAVYFFENQVQDMVEEQIRKSLVSKVGITYSIYEVFNQEDMDFILIFSSLVNYISNAGQSIYGTGSLSQTIIAKKLNHISKSPVKIIDWGYLGTNDKKEREKIRQIYYDIGIDFITEDNAVSFIEDMLHSDLIEAGIINAKKDAIIEGLDGNTEFLYESPEVCKVVNSYIDSMRISPSIEFITDHELFIGTTCNRVLQVLQNITVKGYELSEKYSRWISKTLDILYTHGYILEPDMENIKLSAIDETQLKYDWMRLKEDSINYEGGKEWIELLETVLSNLEAILIGEENAVNIIFPDFSFDLLTNIYQGNVISDYYNDIILELLELNIKQRILNDKNCKLKILEIGAGTGGTTDLLLKTLIGYSDNIDSYTFTDISKAFLYEAEDKYSEISFMKYMEYDVEDSHAAIQMIGSYDIVVATNVLHATKNINNTIRNIKSILKNSGIILINDISKESLIAHMTFGLLDGWWLYNDSDIRLNGSPGISAKNWKKVLNEEGFRDIYISSDDVNKYGQLIIRAASDGLISDIKESRVEQMNQREADGAVTVEKKGTDSIITVSDYLKDIISQVIRIDKEKLHGDIRLEQYGIDSIINIRLITKLREKFTDLDVAVLFEYATINELAEYLVGEYSSLVQRQFGTEHAIGDPKEDLKDAITTEMKSDKIEEDGYAVVGISCKFPGAENLDKYWEVLKEGKNCISEIPMDRFDWCDYYSENIKETGKIYTKYGGFLKNVKGFDPLFFGISPREAEKMDPQERLFLMEAYRCIEDAGYAPGDFGRKEKVGIFVGVMNGHYPTGPKYSSIPNRVSYTFNFTGPSLAVDTACSSSLTALYYAIDSIKSGICDVALVGGTNAIVDVKQYINLCSMNMLSKTNQCSPFGKNADGFVDAEGIAAIMIKPLSSAVKDKDRIYGIIKGCGINTSGRTNGFTVPSPKMQKELMESTLEKCNISPEEISYVEAHGTGTILGDPIEMRALKQVFGSNSIKKETCGLGSVKSNIGHCESASGMASLIKVLLQLKYKKLVPTINCDPVNEELGLLNSPFKLQREYEDWNTSRRRTATVSSFGAGGSNGFVVLQEYVSDITRYQSVNRDEREYAILLSAQTDSSLDNKVDDMLTYLDKFHMDKGDLNSVEYTLLNFRDIFEEKLIIRCSSWEKLYQLLTAYKASNGEQAGIYRFSNEEVKVNKILENCFSEQEIENIIDSNRKNNRVELPLYPFDTEEYWINTNHTVNKKKVIFEENYIYRPATQITQAKKTIIISDDINLFSVIEQCIEESNVIRKLEINNNIHMNLEELFNKDIAKNKRANIILFFAKSIKDYMLEYNMLNKIIEVLKLLHEMNLSANIVVTSISDNLLDRVYMESLAGISNSIRLIDPKIKVCVLNQKLNNEDKRGWVQNAFYELSEQAERYVLYEGRERYVKRLEKKKISETGEGIKHGGTFLITGGLGGLGFAIAKHLSKKYEANLILLGRKKNNDEIDNKVNSLKNGKNQVVYYPCNIGNYNEFSRMIEGCEKKLGKINGVVHAAGILCTKSIFNMNMREFIEPLESKISGSINIGQYFSEKNPDFICFFSSISTVLGDYGACSYAIGNQFEVSYADYLNQVFNIRAVAINWPIWDCGNMGFEDEEAESLYLKFSGQKLLNKKDGIDLFESALKKEGQYFVINAEEEAAMKLIKRMED